MQLLSGARDRVVRPGGQSERLHEALLDAGHASALHLEPGDGHMLHYAQPERIAAAVDAIAAEVGAPVHLRSAREDARAWAGESGV